MLSKVRNYIYDRRRTLGTVAGVAAGIYVAREYVFERIAEIREGIMLDMAAKENLRRRFEQNQEDCTFTVVALLPTLGENILREMDVEALIRALNERRKSARGSASSDVSSVPSGDSSSPSRTALDTGLNIPAPIMPTISGATPVDELPQHSLHDLGAGAGDADLGASRESGRSWVQEFTGQPQAVRDDSPPFSENQMSDSVMSGSGVSEGEQSGVFVPSLQMESSDEASGSEAPRPAHQPTKAELWNEMKILTFARTLTTIYTVSLLSLLSRIQLNILGRHKYLESVRNLEEEQRDRATDDPLTALFWAWVWGDEARIPFDRWGSRELELERELEREAERVGLDTERRYLTFTWWLLNVGWKDVAERVRRAVECVFEPVSLKARLSIQDVERLVDEVRRRIEFEAEDRTARVSFLPVLLPPSPRDEEYVLSQGGFTGYRTSVDPALRTLLDETRAVLSSPAVCEVLGECFDQAARACLGSIELSMNTREGEGGVRMAGLLPAVALWSQQALNGVPNLFVERINDVKGLAGVAALIYASFEDAVLT